MGHLNLSFHSRQNQRQGRLRDAIRYARIREFGSPCEDPGALPGLT